MAANTFDAALIPDTASDLAITVLNNRLASLSCFSTDFSADLVNPLRPNAIPVVTGAEDAETNITDYEAAANSGTTVASALVSPIHVIKRFKLTNAELNSGHNLERLIKKNLQKFADKVLDTVMTPLTVANFGAAHVAATPADLDVTDLKKLWGDASDFSEKNLILQGGYYSQFLPSTHDNFTLQDGAYGFDKFRLNNRFNGAGAGVVGVLADPQAMAIASALPDLTDEVRSLLTTHQVIYLEDLGLSVLFTKWAASGSRTTWCAFEVMIGSKEADTSAAKLIATA